MTLGLAVALLVVGGRALATSASEEAERHYLAGMDLTKRKLWEGALVELRAAAAIVELRFPPEERDEILPVILYEIGLAAEHVSAGTAIAFDAYSRYLAHPPKSPNASALAHARVTVGALASSVGRLTIAGPDGAKISVDQVSSGELPLARPLAILKGIHTIGVSAPGWLPDPLHLEVVITGGNVIELDVRKDLKRPVVGLGMLEVRSQLPGVEILVNGRAVPAVGQLPAGLYKVEVVREGYETFSTAAKVEPGSQITIEARPRMRTQLPDAIAGTLRIACTAPGAIAGVDGELAPELLRGGLRVPTGVHALKVSVPAGGYVEWNQRLEVTKGENPLLSVELVSTIPSLQAPAATAAPLFGSAPAPPEESGSVLSSPIFWTIVGVAVAGGATALAFGIGGASEPDLYGGTSNTVLRKLERAE